MAGTSIGPGTRVKLRFAVKLATGELVDETGAKPATFDLGDGSLLPGFERAMFGMQAGESASLPIPAAQGFGDHRDENVQMLPASAFAGEMKLEPGLVVSFADQQKTELPGVVKRLLGDRVEVDFNHPLAGRDLIFEVEIIEVEQVSDEIARA